MFMLYVLHYILIPPKYRLMYTVSICVNVFNDISLISWWSVFLVEVTEVPEEKKRHVTSY